MWTDLVAVIDVSSLSLLCSTDSIVACFVIERVLLELELCCLVLHSGVLNYLLAEFHYMTI